MVGINDKQTTTVRYKYNTLNNQPMKDIVIFMTHAPIITYDKQSPTKSTGTEPLVINQLCHADILVGKKNNNNFLNKHSPTTTRIHGDMKITSY